MTVSDGVKHSNSSTAMLSAMRDKYITPEYLSPLPPSDCKNGKSPLQLLAQTCSQIGADPGKIHEKSKDEKKKRTPANSPALIVSDVRPVSFKPYEKESSPKVVTLSPSPPGNSVSSKSSRALESTTPIVRSGLEVLSSKDSFSYTNPAFRAPFGFPGFPSPPGLTVCRDPFCRDPACPTALYNAQLAASLSGLSHSYGDLFGSHNKFPMGVIPGLVPLPSSLSSSSGYVCNWMNGREGYCGKRHGTAEELLSHLRSHTNLTSESLYSSHHLLGGLGGRPYGLTTPTTTTSSSASRFHPYNKPSTSSANSMASSHLGNLSLLPPSLYSPSSLYALYGSRLTGSLP